MNHECHSHRETAKKHGRILFIAISIAALFMLIEIIGGIAARSLALISDALHLFADIGALGLGWVIAHFLQRPPTKKLSYGYQRVEAIGAIASVFILWALCTVLIYQAILRFIHPEPVRGGIVFIIALLGLIANLGMMKVLHPTHGDNLNMRAAYLHVLGDLIGSIGVLLSGALIMWTGWNPIDPIITILFALGILYGSIKIVRHATRVLMESTPPDIDTAAVRKALGNLPGVEEVHDLHIWSLSSTHHVLSVHLVAKENPTVLKAAHEVIEKKFGIRHMTIQIENHDHFEPKYCYDCQKDF